MLQGYKNVLKSKSFIISIFLFYYIATVFISCRKENTSDIEIINDSEKVQTWRYLDMSKVPNNAEGELIKYGKELVSFTSKYIGPNVQDSNMRFAGSNLACQNCHIDAGTQPNSLGYVGVFLEYPEYNARTDSIETLRQRINDCLERSLNGKALPMNSKEMNAFVTYIKWLSKEVFPKIPVKGEGLPNIPLLTRAADTTNGRKIYQDRCMSCHADDGRGVYRDNFDIKQGYLTPALWGEGSYNTGAGMYRLITAARFIKSKMPFKDADLSIEDAWDVAAYINSRPRPIKSNLEKDFPNLKKKPVDAPYPPFLNNNFSEWQHKYGPYQEMLKEIDK